MNSLFAVSLAVLAIANGALLTWLFVEDARLPARLCAGAVCGLALLSWIGFLTALVFGLNGVSIGVTIAIEIAILIVVWRSVSTARLRAEAGRFNPQFGGLVYYAAWVALLSWLFSRVVMFYPDGMHTAPLNNFGDLPFHFSVISSFAYGENLPPENPIFAGSKFTYPFLIDFLTAVFIRTGADLRVAFFLENLALSLSLVGLIDLIARKISGSSLAGRLAPVIFLFNGGLGFLNFFRDLGNSPGGGLIALLTHLPGAYTMNAELVFGQTKVPLRWGNVFTTLLIPQRSMLFGLPFVAMIILLWWMAVAERVAPSPRRAVAPSALPPVGSSPRLLLAAGILAGLLPMLHAHGFFAVIVASVAMAMIYRSIDWMWFFVPLAVLAGPQALWLSGTQVRNKLFEPHWWWESGDSNPLLFWMANAGVFILLLVMVLFFRATVRRFYLPFALWFMIPNLVLLAPWPWDNIKVLVYWALASVPFVAALPAHLLKHRLLALRPVGAGLILLLVFSGALDLTRALSPVENVLLFGQEELEVAALLRQQTPPQAVILHAPIHNSAVALSGRRSLMGYPGHLWTHGIAYQERHRDVLEIYQGGARAPGLIDKYRVDYVLIGPVELSQVEPNLDFFSARYPVLFDYAGYRLYRVAE